MSETALAVEVLGLKWFQKFCLPFKGEGLEEVFSFSVATVIAAGSDWFICMVRFVLGIHGLDWYFSKLGLLQNTLCFFLVISVKNIQLFQLFNIESKFSP